MNKFHHFKYLFVFSAVVVGFIGFVLKGPWTWALPIYAYGLVPLVELLSKGSEENMTKAQEAVAKESVIYDLLVYAIVPIQWALYIAFMFAIQTPGLAAYEIVGMIITTGIGCAAFGINVAHELGHRHKWYEQWMSKALLLTSQYMHFFIEHNRGHHANVSTENDPATSRYGEVVFTFWFRSIIGGYLSAWKIESKRLKKAGKPVLHWSNEMIFYAICQAAVLITVALVFNVWVMLAALTASAIGFILLETVNYIEHYGLLRHTSDDRFKRVLPIHSWNSNHPMGRLLLFELSRHSDHHYMASRPYQVLRNFDDAPQMPTGYPGMVMLALVPPLWFAVMNPRVKALREKYPEELRSMPVAA